MNRSITPFLMPGPSYIGIPDLVEVEAAQDGRDRFWLGFCAGTFFGMSALALISPIFS